MVGQSGSRKVTKEKIREKEGRFRLVRNSASVPYSLYQDPDPGILLNSDPDVGCC
jgi:hypothetical protein